MRSSSSAKKKPTDDVNAFLAALDHPLKPEIEAVRKLILGCDKRIRESIKWNAPSFLIEEHFATFLLRSPTTIQVVLHTGAKVKSNARALVIDDPKGLLKWAAKDRCVATLGSGPEIRANKTAFTKIVKQWIAQL